MQLNPIGIFDSGFGGLSVFKEIKKCLPQYDYLYLGDNARAPYGDKPFDVIYSNTLEAVNYLFSQQCPIIILACNTASAKALRTIQQNDLARFGENKKVLGVIRPTAEIVGENSKTKNVGILGTAGTVSSNSYPIEIHKFYPEINVYQQACPLWVPIIENSHPIDDGIDFYIKKDINSLLAQSSNIDLVLMACTHYPLIRDRIAQFLPPNVQLIGQGEIVAQSLQNYLERHTEIEQQLTRNKTIQFYTTGDIDTFKQQGSVFWDEPIEAQHLKLG